MMQRFSGVQGMAALLAVGLVLLLAVPGFAQPPRGSETEITERDTGRGYQYKVGTKFKVNVPDPGDGMQFKDPTFDAKVLKLLGKESKPHPKDKVMQGEVGRVIFTFEAIGVGATDLIVAFFNPAEKQAEPMEMLKVNIKTTK